MPEAKWHYSVQGQSFGPMSREDLLAKVRRGEIKPADHVWCDGMAGWAVLNTVPEFREALPEAPLAAATPAGVRRSHEIDYEILGDDMQIVEVELDPGEVVIAEAGAMNYMDDGIRFEARFGDGSKPDQGFWGKLMEGGKRMLTGESLFLTHFTNAGSGKKRVAFAAPYPGKIVPLDLAALGGTVLCQKDAFLCAAMGTEVGIAFARRLGTGLFGGEGFILQQLRGDGLAFAHAGGTIVQRELRGEKLLVDTGCLVAFTQGIDYDIQRAGGLKSMFFGGEGLFLATLSGSGTVWLQTLPFARLANRILAVARGSGKTAKGEGSILGGIATVFED
ncbi:MAG TPA: TIGR00266 family protein [Phycisphaerae bacterium]|nr:TIGR00266 family protein [Phycisphaerae bacterium]